MKPLLSSKIERLYFKKNDNKYGFFVNNKLRRSTWLISQKILVINLALLMAKLGSWTFWKILEKYLVLLDHKLILLY